MIPGQDVLCHSHAAAVSTPKSTTKSHPRATFHGHTDDHGQKAPSWLYTVQLYRAAKHEQVPVAKVATYFDAMMQTQASLLSTTPEWLCPKLLCPTADVGNIGSNCVDQG